MTTPLLARVTAPLLRENPVTLQILGICSALAVTTRLDTALTLGGALVVVVVLSAGIVSAIRHLIPETIRLIVQIVIVASLVIVIDGVLRAFLPEISRRLSVFVGLITTNCLLLGRNESFARTNLPLPAMADALGNGSGYALVLVVIATVRELFGTGRLLGHDVLRTAERGGWFVPLDLMLLAPAAFFLLGGLVWAIRALRPEQVEPRPFAPPEAERRAT